MDGISNNVAFQQQFALDVQGMEKLKHTTETDAKQGLEEASRQFEALFLHMMLKSMRDAIPESGLMQSQQGDFYESLLDQQWSQHLSGKGLGLADQLTRQLNTIQGGTDANGSN